ncbi:hypothetical protein P3342_003865 [Pyrenophora teres f. teres]|nr:hypothetical protein P3342_003865 [Pyrenophora teres f. teres]
MRRNHQHHRTSRDRNTITAYLPGLCTRRPIAHHERPFPPPLREGRCFPRAYGCPPLGPGTPRPHCEPKQEARGRHTADDGPQVGDAPTHPFFFVNETTVAFVLLPGLIYIFSKYILPQRLRLFAARLFISKL